MSAVQSYDEKLIQKIKGLLDTSTERGASEAEAASAARLVEQILLKHGLDREQVEKQCESLQDFGECGTTGIQLGTGPNEEWVWAIGLAHNVSQLCFCRSLLSRDDGTQVVSLVFVGSQTDSLAAAELCKWLMDRGQHFANAEWDKTNPNVQQIPYQVYGGATAFVSISTSSYFGFSRDKDLFLRSFLLGYAQRLNQDIQARLTQRDEEAQSCDLVVSQMANADAFVEKICSGKPPETKIHQSAVDHDAMIRGLKAGAESPLEVAPSLV